MKRSTDGAPASLRRQTLAMRVLGERPSRRRSLGMDRSGSTHVPVKLDILTPGLVFRHLNVTFQLFRHSNLFGATGHLPKAGKRKDLPSMLEHDLPEAPDVPLQCLCPFDLQDCGMTDVSHCRKSSLRS